jgi:hypothetical protein
MKKKEIPEDHYRCMACQEVVKNANRVKKPWSRSKKEICSICVPCAKDMSLKSKKYLSEYLEK